VARSRALISPARLSIRAVPVRRLGTERASDQLHLCLYPVTRGSGPRLFPEQDAPGRLSLVTCESYDNDVTYLAYRTQA
jgi:hypothetical protein